MSIGLGVSRALPSAHIAVGDVANPPGIVVLGLEFLVEGNAGGSQGGEGGPWGGGAHVKGLRCIVGAVGVVEYPVVICAAGRSARSPVVGVLVHALDSNFGVVLGGESGIGVVVDTQTVVLDGIDPAGDFGGGVGGINIGGFGRIPHVEEGVNLGIEVADSGHLLL